MSPNTYRLLIPKGYNKSKHFPLVMFLHGYGERGTDNKHQLKFYGSLFVQPEIREKHPCFVLAPQTPGTWINFPDPADKPIRAPKQIPASVAMALEILDAVEKKYSVDKQRIYLSGASNGACGVWYLLERDSKRWAAAVPVCGAGDPSLIGAAHNVPIWAYQGGKDKEILPARGRELIDALKAAGGNPKYTEFPGLGHGPGIKKAYSKAVADAEWLPWMFEQKRKHAK